MADHTPALSSCHPEGVADPADLEAELDRLREENAVLRSACIAAQAATSDALGYDDEEVLRLRAEVSRLTNRLAMVNDLASAPAPPLVPRRGAGVS